MKTIEKKASRKITSTAVKAVPTELTALAVEHYVENKKANAASGKSNKARAALYGGMKNEGFAAFDVTTNIDGKPVILHAEIGAGSQEKVDSEKLFALYKSGRIKEADFIATISATKAAVESLGKDIFAQCAMSVTLAENVTVKPKG